MKLFITGGAGFIGCNTTAYFLRQGHEIVLFDNLSRVGGAANLAWLKNEFGDRFTFVQGDIREYGALTAVIGGSDVVIHLASQVAVTSSVLNPREDFEINAVGTFNVLEASRHLCPQAVFIYASTNKVYGGMTEVQIVEQAGGYGYADYPFGIPEDYPLDFHSPYGCSKGAGDQYTLDYARIYGLRSVVFRQSCIYGRRQFGVEDQGWVAHFVIAAVMERPITIFGDGKQVRDLLHVDDLIRAYSLAIDKIEQVKGRALNLGGGPENTLSVWQEFGPLLSELAGRPLAPQWGDWRPGDQRVFIADIRQAAARLGWRPTISPRQGIADLYHWVSRNPALFQ